MCHNARITWLSESTNSERGETPLENAHLSVFIQRTIVRVCSKAHLSVFIQRSFCPCLVERTFVRRMIDPTFVRVVPYICPSLTKRTSVRILSNQVRFTKQVCPDLCQIGCRQQFGQNTARIRITAATWRHSVRLDAMRSEGAACNHQLTQPSYATQHVSRTEQNSA
jgi:hypothetical protein